jgi:hypothetical protein
MYIDPRLTDAEILKACTYAESPHLRVVAQRLRERIIDICAAQVSAREAKRALEDGLPDMAVEKIKLCIDQLNRKP